MIPCLCSRAAEPQPVEEDSPVFAKPTGSRSCPVSSVDSAAIPAPASPVAPVATAAPSDLSAPPASESAVELPKVTVLARKQVLPDEKDVLSRTDKAALLLRRYPGASLKGQDPERSRVPNYAALMYREDERLRQLRTFKDLAAGVRLAGDEKGAAELEKEAKSSLMRGHDMRTEAMDRSANNDRR